jgi:tetratricopeptide (TPR) repeat protein
MPPRPLLVLVALLPALAVADPVSDLVARLKQPPQVADAEKRAVLHAIHAEVPNEKGSFTYPGRPPKKTVADPDWLAELRKLPPGPAVAEVIDKVTVLRALADTKTDAAATAILDFGFTPEGLVYRDECGRLLRGMSPHSLPALLRASTDKKRDAGSYARYANYQLDRLSMNRPSYALAAAPDDRLEVAMLDAIREVRHPDAVTAVLDRVDAPSNAVRKAARQAWLAYVEGPPPPPAPKAFRKLPGGKRSDEPLPLYLTYRELADQELRRVLFAQTGTQPEARLDVMAMTKKLFDLYDQRRAEQTDALVAGVKPLEAAGKWAEATERYDTILRGDPLYVRRAAMAPAYLELGRLRAADKKWDEAVAAYHKALALDPEGPHAAGTAAALAEARGERERAAGRSGAEDLAAANAMDPARGERPASSDRGWLLWLGVGAAIAGAILVVVALVVRRRGFGQAARV